MHYPDDLLAARSEVASLRGLRGHHMIRGSRKWRAYQAAVARFSSLIRAEFDRLTDEMVEASQHAKPDSALASYLREAGSSWKAYWNTQVDGILETFDRDAATYRGTDPLHWRSYLVIANLLPAARKLFLREGLTDVTMKIYTSAAHDVVHRVRQETADGAEPRFDGILPLVD